MKILDEFIAEIKKFGMFKLSKKSGVSYTAIYQWVNKRKIPTLLNAQKCANAMGLEFLIFEELED
jgi:DNA-binding phage protein